MAPQLVGLPDTISLRFSKEIQPVGENLTFTLKSITYTPGAGDLKVFVNNKAITVNKDYTEDSETTVTLFSGVADPKDNIMFVVRKG